ncbi:hypothetical protein [Streptomyces sp. NPDC052042]|uniref:hypothetical protein n=1 Tax=Streptomyces sp. NPDC052042 TaxID=3365683 RepID=UPI0037D29105
MSHPQSYEILLVPGFAQAVAGTAGTGTSGEGAAGTENSGTGTSENDTAGNDAVGNDIVVLRSAVVAATGETGASGYPRYAGEGVVADIDPATRTVEALLVDGAELDYGLSVRVKEKSADAPGSRAGD